VKIVATFPENTHPAIIFPVAVLKDAKPGAKAFLAFLSTPDAKATFRKAGFTVLRGK
ncbi:MAG: substrate-binding domain-containing protein, partial [Alphaproteobacteria bacterium]|nr:substrate-binding domain-containing protein [Alphaproteobacteria bacterium]